MDSRPQKNELRAASAKAGASTLKWICHNLAVVLANVSNIARRGLTLLLTYHLTEASRDAIVSA